MAQTKRKRRNKHRGNAVGAVEARGRTSKPSEGAKPAGGGRGGRGAASSRTALREPTLRSAATKALIGIAVLFIFFRFLSKGTTTGQALAMCAVAFVLYTPLMYLTDRWVYKRKLKAQPGGSGARR